MQLTVAGFSTDLTLPDTSEGKKDWGGLKISLIGIIGSERFTPQ